MMPKISIVVPVYNVEKYLKECIDSIRNQTLKEIEIICVDDGSTDTSGEILDQYAKEDGRFRIVHKPNEGYGKAMNVGIGMATAPYIGIVESDDIIAYDMYESLYILMEEKQVDVLKTNFYEFYDNGEGEYIEEYTPLVFYNESRDFYDKVFNIKECEDVFLAHRFTWSGLYRRKFLQEEHIVHNETPGASYQDNGFWFQTMVKAKSMYFSRQAFYRYRIDNPNSSMNNKSKPFAICEEYDFVRGILGRMGEPGKRYYKWTSFIKIVDGLNIIPRVEDKYKVELAERIRKEVLQSIQLGEIDIELYSDDRKLKIFDILADPVAYVENEKIRRRKIEKIGRDYDTIILYGAGKIGCQVQKILKEGRLNTKIKYFAVTEMGNNKETVLGIPVKKIDDLLDYKEKALVIISAGRNYVEEIIAILKMYDFRHYILHEQLLQ